MRLLHLLRKPPDTLTKEMLEKQSHEHEITVVLIQQGVLTEVELPGHVFALDEDLLKEGLERNASKISYRELLGLIFDHERIFCW